MHFGILKADGPKVIPFYTFQNTILIKAVIEEVEGYLILDTGAPSLVLNQFYFSDKKTQNVNYEVSGLNSRIEIVKARTTTLTISTLHWTNEHAITLDLQHLKPAQSFPILGLAGYKLFDEYEMVFDYQRSEILLFELDRSGSIRDASFSNHQPEIIVPLKQKGHLPYLEIVVGETSLKMGLDTGAEISLIHPKLQQLLAGHLKAEGFSQLIGVGKKRTRKSLWKLYNVKCSFLLFKAINVVFADFQYFDDLVKGPQLDGILGTEFLSQFLMAINTKKQELHIWFSNKQEVLVSQPGLEKVNARTKTVRNSPAERGN